MSDRGIGRILNSECFILQLIKNNYLSLKINNSSQVNEEKFIRQNSNVAQNVRRPLLNLATQGLVKIDVRSEGAGRARPILH